MVKTEIVGINGKSFCKHYSDSNKYIRQVETGNEFTEAINLYPCNYTYEETDKEIESYDMEGERND